MAASKFNVDESQYKFMAHYADTWWDKHGPMETLHSMNTVRVPFVCNQLEMLGKIKDKKSLKGLKILDVGCGAGIFVEALAKLGATVVGIDPVEELIESAKNHLKSQFEIAGSVKYFCETVEEHRNRNSDFYDVVVCCEVMEHVEDKKSLAEGCSKVLKPGGDFFLTTPNKTFSSWFFVIFWAETILGIIERGSHKWSWFIHHNDMSAMLREFGVRTLSVKGINYFPIFKKWTISNYKDNNFILHAVKENFPQL